MLVGLLEAASKLEGRPVSQITSEVLFEVANVVEAGESMGVRVDWFDNMLGKILKAKDHYKFAHNVDLIRKCMEDLQSQ